MKRMLRANISLCIMVMFFLSALTNLQAQEKTITGTIIDPGTKEPLIGASILVKGSIIGTITDLDGKFTINATEGQTLIVSYIGYTSKEIKVGSTNVISIQLKPDSHLLDDVVVIGYGTQKRSDLTGSISQISAEDLKRSPAMSAEQAIQGKSAGVMVASNSGAPGSPVTVNIRGKGSFGNSDPLYIVDGMPIKDASFGKEDNPSGISFLNPSDIESMQILKDASACAIYGTRGSNGVIIITTKRGKSGAMKVDFDAYYGMQALPKKISLCNAQQFATLWNANKVDNLYDPATIPGLQTTDWQNEVFKVAPTHNAQLSVSGGKENNTFYISANKFSQDGILKGSKFDRNTLRLNSDNKVNDWLKIGESFSFMQSDRDRQNENGAYGGVNGNPIYAALYADPTVRPFDSTGNWSYLPRTSAAANPVGLNQRQNYNYKTTRIQGSVYAEIEIIKNLKYKFNTGIDNSWGVRNEFLPKFFVAGAEQSPENYLSTEHESWSNWLVENTLNYNLLKGNHKLDFLAGYTSQAERKENMIISSVLPNDDPTMRYQGSVESLNFVKSTGGAAREWSLLSQLGRVNYAFSDKYLLTASVRRDGSSRFGSNRRYAIFPSVSFGWKISEEKFFKNISFLSPVNLMKVRIGWGKVGNQNIPAYAYLTQVSNRPDLGVAALEYWMGNPQTRLPRYVQLGYSNADIGWEESKTANFGMDVSLWDNKITSSIDLYNKTTTGLIIAKPVAAYLGGFGDPQVNAGNLVNKGVEFSLSYKKYEGDFNYEITGNLSKNINNVTSLAGGVPLSGGANKVFEGRPIGVFYGYVQEGIFQSKEDIKNHAFQTDKTAAGDFKFKDLNNDGIINEQDQTVIGNAIPSFTYGFIVNASYKGFDLSIFMQGVQGNMLLNQLKQQGLYNYTLNSNVSPDLLNYWGKVQDDGTILTNTNIPRLGKDGNNNQRFSTYYLEDGSYFRIKTISLGYTIPKKLIEKIKIASLRIYVTGQNLITFTKYSGYDPEIGRSNGWNASPLSMGIDNGIYPQPKAYLVGVNVSF